MLSFCAEPRSLLEIAEYLGYKDRRSVRRQNKSLHIYSGIDCPAGRRIFSASTFGAFLALLPGVGISLSMNEIGSGCTVHSVPGVTVGIYTQGTMAIIGRLLEDN